MIYLSAFMLKIVDGSTWQVAALSEVNLAVPFIVVACFLVPWANRHGWGDLPEHLTSRGPIPACRDVVRLLVTDVGAGCAGRVPPRLAPKHITLLWTASWRSYAAVV